MDIGLRFREARSGDSISRLMGSSDPRAIGKFLAVNGLAGGDSTLRAGRSYVVPTDWDDATEREAELGNRLLGQDNARLRALADSRQAREQREAEQVALLLEGRNIWTGDRVVPTSQPMRRRAAEPASRLDQLDRDPTVKALAGGLGWSAGLVPGFVRGGINTVKGAAEGGYFLYRLSDPTDSLRSLPGNAARDQLAGAAKNVGVYAARALNDPSVLREDVEKAFHNFRQEQDPFASPVATTAREEFARKFEVGKNNGELIFDAGSFLVGGEALKGAAGIGRLAKAPTEMELAFFAKHPGVAARFSEPYKGMSHHIIKRSATMPKFLGGGKYPKWLIESEFNKIRHEGISTRDLYRNHVGVDRQFGGGKVGAPYGGTKWSALEDLGWEPYSPIDRLKYGTSPYTKAAVGPVLFGGPLADISGSETGR